MCSGILIRIENFRRAGNLYTERLTSRRSLIGQSKIPSKSELEPENKSQSRMVPERHWVVFGCELGTVKESGIVIVYRVFYPRFLQVRTIDFRSKTSHNTRCILKSYRTSMGG